MARIQSGGALPFSGSVNNAGLRTSIFRTRSSIPAPRNPKTGEMSSDMPTSCALAQFTPSPKAPPLSIEFARPTPRIEPSLGFFFTQTGFRCAEPLKKGVDADRRQLVNLPGNACALGRLFVVHAIAKVAPLCQRYKPRGSEQRPAKDE